MKTSEDRYAVPRQFAGVDELCRNFIERTLESMGDCSVFSDYERTGSDDIERIENESRPGFYPYTQGGWRVMPFDYLHYADGSGHHAGLLSSYIDEQKDYCARSYLADNDLADDAMVMPESELWEYIHGLADPESFYEYESEWMGSPFYLDIRATYFRAKNWRNPLRDTDRPVVDCVDFTAWINFDEYGRDSHAVMLWGETLPVDELNIGKAHYLAACACEALETMEAKAK